VWLAELAAADRGLVGRLAKAHGGFAAALAQPRAALVASVRHTRAADGVPEPSAAGVPGTDEEVVTWCDELYPPRLRELFDPPPALYVRGRRRRALLRALRLRPTVAVVGGRGDTAFVGA